MHGKRNIYLEMKSLADARHILFSAFPPENAPAAESIPVTKSVGRVLAEPVYAALSSPNYHSAAMDGVAVTAEKTYGASDSTPMTLHVGTEAFYVNTGHVLPAGTNAVIMIEHVWFIDDDHVRIEAPVFPWQYVRRMGEDIVATQLLFPRYHTITPYCMGALISAGIRTVPVIRPPRLLILPTGSELVEAADVDADTLFPGKVIESNAHVLKNLAEGCGAAAVRHPIIIDDPAEIKQTVSDAAFADWDMILVIGGSSAGTEDYARAVISNLGEVLVHGVTIMPGKPTVIGRINGKPVFGIPGYPVSAIIAFEQFVKPLIYAMIHRLEPEEETVSVIPTRKIPSKLGLEEFLRVKLGRVGDRIVATTLPRGAGTITSITEADGIIRIPSHVEGIAEDETVSARLLRPRQTIDDTIVIVGSHDNTIDVLADLIRARHGRYTLSSSHVGSMGGLMAIKRGLCHLAGAHLLDTADGTYNISYIRRYLPDIPVHLVRLADRDQGLIIPKGNPKQITGIADLGREDIVFINRQTGSGTRILLDYHLEKIGLAPDRINGFENEEFTHMAVAVAVLGDSADAGMGIYAAAKALHLDFIPIATESYELVIPESHFHTDRIQRLIEVINSREFSDRIHTLGGYHTQNTGQVIWSSDGCPTH